MKLETITECLLLLPNIGFFSDVTGVTDETDYAPDLPRFVEILNTFLDLDGYSTFYNGVFAEFVGYASDSLSVARGILKPLLLRDFKSN